MAMQLTCVQNAIRVFKCIDTAEATTTITAILSSCVVAGAVTATKQLTMITWFCEVCHSSLALNSALADNKCHAAWPQQPHLNQSLLHAGPQQCQSLQQQSHWQRPELVRC